MGVAVSFYFDGFRGLPSLGALLVAVWLQIGTNFANDYFDYVQGADTGDRFGPTRATQAGLVNPETMKKAFILVCRNLKTL